MQRYNIKFVANLLFINLPVRKGVKRLNLGVYFGRYVGD